MEDDAPNFSYAYQGSSTSSWNPALRPDDKDPQDISNSLQPSPQIIPQSKPALDDDDSEDDVPPIPVPSATVVHPSNVIPPPRLESSEEEEEDDEDEDDEDDEEDQIHGKDKDGQEEEDDEGDDEDEEEEEDDDDEDEEDDDSSKVDALPTAAAVPLAQEKPTVPSSAPAATVEESDDEEDEEEEDSSEVNALPIAAAAAAAVPLVQEKPTVPSSAPAATIEESDDEEDEDEDEDENSSEANPLPTAAAAAAPLAQEKPAVASSAPAVTAEESDDESEEESEDEPEQQSSEEEHPEDNYEHQGESSLLEQAVAESENVPLVANAQSNSDDWGTSGDDVFDLGSLPQDTLAEAPLQPSFETSRPEAGGTTVGDEFIENTRAGGNVGESSDDWGTGGGDDFFGQTVTSLSIGPAQPFEESAGAHVVQPSGEPPSTSDSAWDLDLDDDFLPDAEESTPVFELDDDEGFLEDEPAETSQPLTQPVAVPATSRYAPAAANTPTSSTSAYGVPTPQLTNLPQPNPPSTVATPAALFNTYGQSAIPAAPARPGMPSSAESFAAKARGGYHSPYDLPEDIVTTRKRPAPRTASVPAAPPSAPPRTSSIPNVGAQPPPASNASVSSIPSPSYQAQMTGLPQSAPPKPALSKAPPNFFEELPVTSKPKASGRYTPQHGVPQQPAAYGLPPKERTASWSSLRNEVKQEPDNLIAQLQQPERLPVFPDQPTAPVRTNSLPVPQPATAPPSNRYSPAPAQAPSAPAANMRYSPAPPSAPTANTRYSPAPPPGTIPTQHGPLPSGPPRPPSQNYLPRTSSPLAYHAIPHQPEDLSQVPQHVADLSRSSLEGVRETEEQPQQQFASPPPTARSATPPVRSTPSSAVSSPRKRSNYAPQYQSMDSPSAMSTLPRAESPSMAMKMPAQNLPSRDPSIAALGAPFQPAYNTSAGQNINVIPPRSQPSLQYDCIPPTDERASDPLERWRGYPIFKWGLGGTVISTYPKQVPRYGGGASAPMVKCSPGEVRIQNAKAILPLSDDIAKFPGPLKSKSKKKDVSAWLAQRIAALEARQQTPGLDQSISADDLKRLDEKTLLWKVLHVFIDNDGALTGNAAVEAAVRKVFSSDTSTSVEGEGSFTTAADLVGRPRSNTAGIQADPVDPKAVEELKLLLTKGDREKAVWHAVDQRLWAHAMLLSSTLNKTVWKQVVQEFVQKEVKKLGRDNQALAVLYEIFAGNHDDCIDELVPASARAGFQMMSTDGAGQTDNALQGLDKWRETLSLVLNNRSEGDPAALVSLGKLLASYGRVEAAHICFIFARSQAHINGVDDPEANIVLIGSDQKHNPLDLGIDLDSVLLTEIYEFGLSLSAPGGSHIIPHLQNYKLAHAYQLAEYGYRADAQAYCDAIAASMKATTRVSPYYNGSFVTMLDDLTKRLSQSPKDGGWLSKPISSSLFSKFTNFVAGDDEDNASNQSIGEVGPFAKITGNTPALSPAQSTPDLYGAYSGFGISAPAPATSTNSKYAPTNTYASRTSMESTRSKYEPLGRSSLDSNEGNMGIRAVSDSYIPSPPLPSSFAPPQPSQPQLSPHLPSLSKSHSYSPLRSEYTASEPSYGGAYQPAAAGQESTPAYGGFQPPAASFDDTQAETSGFQPPTNAYEPSSYQPYQPNEEDSPEQSLKPKKSFMDDDDDDDLVTRAAGLKISSSPSKADKDRAADEAFRKAAEEDAKRDKEAAAQKKSGGWLGGWFGGAKKDNIPPANKPIRAKLGEENAFKYDEVLKKWVNTKGGAEEASKPAATPPPPRSGPPSRAVSTQSTAGPPNSLPNTNGLPVPPTSNPLQRSSSMPPPMGLPGSRASTPGLPSDSEGRPPVLQRPGPLATGPPSRPGTGMSTASSIDDLLGAPQARKGAAKGKKKGGRYVDVMAKP